MIVTVYFKKYCKNKFLHPGGLSMFSKGVESDGLYFIVKLYNDFSSRALSIPLRVFEIATIEKVRHHTIERLRSNKERLDKIERCKNIRQFLNGTGKVRK